MSNGSRTPTVDLLSRRHIAGTDNNENRSRSGPGTLWVAPSADYADFHPQEAAQSAVYFQKGDVDGVVAEMSGHEEVAFAPEEADLSAAASEGRAADEVLPLDAWKVMLVDDEPEIHSVTKLALEDFCFEDKPLTFLSAFSGQEARRLIQTHQDTALILLDVVMETEHAGLDLVEFIRDTINNRLVRIVLRTGQPGQAPEDRVIIDYDINDYKTKTELTYNKLFTTVVTALRAFELVTMLERQRSENARLNAELESYNRTLEQKVEQRTAELAQAMHEAQTARVAAESANAAKSAFLANMNHELRTPLNAIISYTRIVRRRSSDLLPAKQLGNLDNVLASSEHLLRLINTILDISKIEAGRVTVHPVLFEPAQLIEECLQMIQPLVNADQVALNKEVEPELPPVRSDRDKIKQILINLLSNAVKFTRQGSIRVSARLRADRLVYAVVDTGIGIPADELERIFEAFHQVDSSSTRPYGGTGLGLSLSLRLARLLQGELTVASKVGEGSTFELSLPLLSAIDPADEVLLSPGEP